MAFLFQIEKTSNPPHQEPIIIKSGQAVTFDLLPAALSETGHIPDFVYEAATGAVTILKAGSYLVNWSVAQLTGLSRNGQTFQLLLQTKGAEEFARKASSHSPSKSGTANGFSILELASTQVPAKVLLKNAADHDAALSTHYPIVASLSLYGMPAPASFQDSMHLQLSPNKYNKPALDYSTVPPQNADEGLGFEVYGLGQLIDPETDVPVETGGILANPTIPFDKILADAATATPRDDAGAPFSNDGLIQLDGAYADATGNVIVYESGRYELKWEIPIEATQHKEDAYVALQVSSNHLEEEPVWSTYSKSYIPLPRGVVNGSAIIDLTDVSAEKGTALRLANDSHTKIRVSHFANLIIRRIT